LTDKPPKDRPGPKDPPGEAAVRGNLKRLFGKLAFEKGPAYPGEEKPEEKGGKADR